MGSDNHLYARGIIRRWIRYIAFVLVNLSSILFTSLGLFFVFWFVILGEKQYFLSSINRHDCSTVSHICDETDVSNDHHDDGTRSTSFNEVLFRPALLVGPLKEDLFSFSYSILNSHLWILGEIVIPNDQLVKLISKVISTCCTSMSVIYCKE